MKLIPLVLRIIIGMACLPVYLILISLGSIIMSLGCLSLSIAVIYYYAMENEKGKEKNIKEIIDMAREIGYAWLYPIEFIKGK